MNRAQSQINVMATLVVTWMLVAPSSLSYGATIGRFQPDETLSERSQINKNPLYTTWENPQEILYRFDTDFTYSTTQRQLIEDAMALVTSDMTGCIRFVQWNRTLHAGKEHLVIAKTFNNGIMCETCFTFPGRLLRATQGQGQKLCLVDGTNGCLNTTELAPVRGREVMKYLVSSLGVRNELNRPDRDDFVDVIDANILTELRNLNLTKKYEASNVLVMSDFDFNSITLPDPFKYATPGRGPLYQPKQRVVRASLAASLSDSDKIGVLKLYPQCLPAVDGASSTTGIPLVTSTAAGSPDPDTVDPAVPVTGLPPVTVPVNPDTIGPEPPTGFPDVAVLDVAEARTKDTSGAVRSFEQQHVPGTSSDATVPAETGSTAKDKAGDSRSFEQQKGSAVPSNMTAVAKGFEGAATAIVHDIKLVVPAGATNTEH